MEGGENNKFTLGSSGMWRRLVWLDKYERFGEMQSSSVHSIFIPNELTMTISIFCDVTACSLVG
jgi:hypothetical protein